MTRCTIHKHCNMFQTRQQHSRTFSRAPALWHYPEVAALGRNSQQSPFDLYSSWLLLSISWLKEFYRKKSFYIQPMALLADSRTSCFGDAAEDFPSSSKHRLPRMCSIAHTLPAVSSLLSHYCSARCTLTSATYCKGFYSSLPSTSYNLSSAKCLVKDSTASRQDLDA
jgi:hypothetical protein